MNKNLKRALNTTAAVSMSLAMVLGAVAPVTDVSAATVANVTESQKINAAYSYFESLYYGLKTDVTDVAFDTANIEYEVKYSDAAGAKHDLFVLSGQTTGTEVAFNQLVNLQLATGGDVWTVDTKLTEMVSYVANDGEKVEDFDQNVVDFAKHLYGPDGEGIAAAINTFKALVAKDSTFDVWAKEDLDFGNGNRGDSNYKAAAKALGDVKAYKAYAKNAGYTDDEVEALEEKIGFLQDNIDSYKDENEDNFTAEYVKTLENLEVVKGEKDTTVYNLVERGTDIKLDKLSTLEKFVRDVKGNKISALKDIAKYDDVKENDEVAAYVEGLEAIIEEMKEAKELLKTTNEAYKDYKKLVGDKVENLADTVSTAKDDKDSTREEKIEAKLNAFRTEDITAMKAYVEEVVEKFYTITPKQLKSGNYRIDLENADYGRYLDNNDQKDNALFGISVLDGLYDVLTTPVDAELSEETYYDVLVSKVTTVEDLVKAVTEDIEGLTFNTKLTSDEAKKIVAARKALDTLMDRDRDDFDAEYKTALTKAEKKEIESNITLIDTLYMKLLYTGEVTTIGWVETPQGWEYYDNNGKRVMEGWAPGNGYWSYMKNGYSVANDWCAAKEGWYYMGADGKMVTGIVTIDGVDYNFGTDGIWVR